MQDVGAGFGGAGGTSVSMGGFATGRGFGAVRVGFFDGFGVGVALRLGAAPIDSTALTDGLASALTSSDGESVGSSLTATGAARDSGLCPLPAQPTNALSNSPASAAPTSRCVCRTIPLPPPV
ncbi:hypothetical protein Misp05_33850 [Micromonospora sp. NBRC 107095]|nr:hypothetical protein Misp05_33850 [Micromonospora sp. NBRC 107095]